MTSDQFSLRGKQRVLFVISRFLDGGIDTVLLELLNNLLRNSPHVHCMLVIANKMAGKEVFFDKLPPEVEVHYLVDERWLQWYKVRKLEGRRNRVLSLLDEMFLNPIRQHLLKRRFRRLQQEVDVVIDIDSRAHSIIDWTQLTLNIAYFHFSFQHMLDAHPHYMRRVAKGLKNYDYVVSISKEMAEEGARLFPWLQDKLVTIYNGVRKDHLLLRADEVVSHPLWYRLSRQGFILAVERLEESQKDITSLIEAYALLSARSAQLPYLVVLGEGHDRDLLQTLINQRGMSQRIFLLGFTENPYPWMKHAQMMVHSSKFEGLPTVLIEGLMLGKLIVSTDCPTGPREILANGKAGVLVPVGDVEALAQAMQDILTDVALQERLRASISYQVDVFRPQKNIVKLLDILGEN